MPRTAAERVAAVRAAAVVGGRAGEEDEKGRDRGSRPLRWERSGGAERGHGRRDRSGRRRRRGAREKVGSLTASEEEESALLVFTRAPLYLYSGQFLGAVPDLAAPTNAFVGVVPDPAAPTNIFYFFKLLILYFLYHKNTK